VSPVVVAVEGAAAAVVEVGVTGVELDEAEVDKADVDEAELEAVEPPLPQPVAASINTAQKATTGVRLVCLSIAPPGDSSVHGPGVSGGPFRSRSYGATGSS
jgi:hypothetical protein